MVLSTPESPVVGIDLGTTFARVGVWQNDRVEIVPSCDGSYSTPSYVAFTETSRLIGHAAKYQLTRNARNTVFGMNQLVGRKFSDPEVQRSMKHWPFKVICGQNDNPEVEAKRALSSSTETYIELDALHDGIDYYATITRAEMENLSADLFDKALQLVQKVLRDARVAKDRIREVVGGGGSARSPKMLQLLKDFFSDKALSSPIRPDEGAAFGVTVQAAILNCVASPTLYDFIMLDVTPLSLWAEAVMRVRIFEGEHSDMSANCLLGTIDVDNIPLKPRGESEIEVTLDINADDIVNVSVKEISTGLEKNLSIGTDAREELRLGSKTALESYANAVCSSATANIAELKRSIADMQAIKDSATDTLHWLNGNHSAEKEAFDVKRQKLEEVATPATRGSSGDATTAA
ncbi:hypothetical protein PRNP1_012645 [Phytophthora ramorum]